MTVHAPTDWIDDVTADPENSRARALHVNQLAS